jgi:hypothetical protein
VTPIHTASLVALIAALGFIATDRALAAEPLQVISSDSDDTTHFMALGMSKSAVIQLSADMKDVIVADPSVVTVVVKSKRRVFLVGTGHGLTNLYFFDADGRQIGALEVAVTPSKTSANSMPSQFEYDPFHANHVVVFRGLTSQLYSCTPTTCISSLSNEEEKEEKTTREIGTPLITNNNGGGGR